MDLKKLVIIGSGIAGLSAAIAARKRDDAAEITVLSQESDPPFYRLRLEGLIGKEVPFESLYIHPPAWYDENRIALLLSHTVLSVDVRSCIVRTDKGDFPFDSLVVTSGSTPIMPPFAGRNLAGVVTLWNLQDIASINGLLKTSRHAVVIGGGLLGLETAYSIKQLNIPVTLIEGMPRLLPKQLDEDGSALFKKKVESMGITVVTGQSVSAFQGEGHVEELVLADGQVMEADIVVVSVGVKPNTGICDSCEFLKSRYIQVDDRMKVLIAPDELPYVISSNTLETTKNPKDAGKDPKSVAIDNDDEMKESRDASMDSLKSCTNIYAAGDVASFHNEWFGLWAVAAMQGQIAGANAAGGDEHYHLESSPYILSTMGTRIVVYGMMSVEQAGDVEFLQDIRPDTYSYIKLVFQEKILRGGILIGEFASKYTTFQMLIKNKATRDIVLQSDLLSKDTPV